MSETSVLEAVQQDIADRLLSDPYFSNIPVVTENLHDIENEIERSIKALGIVCIIVTPTADVRETMDAPGPYFDDINIVVQVSEMVMINRGVGGTGKTNLAVCEHVLALLHRYVPANIIEAVYAIAPTLSLVPDQNGLLTRHCNFRTQGGLKYDVPTVADPIISHTGGTVTITCATPHAVIVYSTDGTYPAPRLTVAPGTSSYYSTPFSASGVTVKARAWLPGYMNSKQVSQVV